MKFAHEMNHWERKELLEQRQENAAYLARINQEMADGCKRTSPGNSADYQKVSDGWQRESERLKGILKTL